MRGMTSIVKTVARGTAGLIFLYGLYVVLHGHLAPGGGFDGGVLLSAAFVLLILAYGSEEKASEGRKQKSLLAISGGVLAFWSLAIMGMVLCVFFYNFVAKGKPFHLLSGGFIPLSNIAIGVEVGAGLFAMFLALATFKTGGRK